MPPIETPLQRRRRELAGARAARAVEEERARIARIRHRHQLAEAAQAVRAARDREDVAAAAPFVARRVVPRVAPPPAERPVVFMRQPEFQQAVNWNFGEFRPRPRAIAVPAEPALNLADMQEFGRRLDRQLEEEQREFEERLEAAPIPQAQNPPSVAKIEKEADEMPERLANTFLIGCDPEFVVMDKADTVFNVVNAGIGQKGEVGYDHSGLVLEIRPSAAKGTYALMKRIKQIIDNNDKLKLVNGKKWRAGAVVKTKLVGRGDVGGQPERTLTLGGHVHLDLPPVGYGGVDQELHNIRLSAMDRMTKYLEGLDILPKNESAVRREEGAKAMHGSRYGQWGDWRPAGGEAERTPVRLEYRTPASWLYSQQATFLTLTGVKLAMVSPQLAMDTLKIRNISYDNLKAFFELYRHKDANARRVLDCLLDKRVEDLQADPDRDVREAWKTLEF